MIDQDKTLVNFSAQAEKEERDPRCISWVPELLVPGLGQKLISNNIDTLHLGVNVSYTGFGFLDLLSDSRNQLRIDEKEKMPFYFDGWDTGFNIHSTGKGKSYAYHLSSGDIHLFFSHHKPESETPNVFIEIGSISCWSPGVEIVMQEIQKLFERIGGVFLRTKINRVDMAADILDHKFNSRSCPFPKTKNWIRRTRRNRVELNGIEPNAIILGVKAKRIQLRVYDKVLEMVQQKSYDKIEFFSSLWGVKDIEEIDVTRCEFQLRKPALREFQIVTFEELMERLQGLWEYLTQEWFRIAEKIVNRSNQTTAKIHPLWQIIQKVTWKGLKSVFRTQPKQSLEIDPLMNQIVGCLLRVNALMRKKTVDVDSIVYMSQGLIEGKMRALNTRKLLMPRYDLKLREIFSCFQFQPS